MKPIKPASYSDIIDQMDYVMTLWDHIDIEADAEDLFPDELRTLQNMIRSRAKLAHPMTYPDEYGIKVSLGIPENDPDMSVHIPEQEMTTIIEMIMLVGIYNSQGGRVADYIRYGDFETVCPTIHQLQQKWSSQDA